MTSSSTVDGLISCGPKLVRSLQNEGAEGRSLECLSGLKLRTVLASLMSVVSGRMDSVIEVTRSVYSLLFKRQYYTGAKYVSSPATFKHIDTLLVCNQRSTYKLP